MIFRHILKRLALAILLVVGACTNAQSLTIFAASSLTDVVDALAADFAARSGYEVRVVTAASSTLARQIEKGAPADVFISANKEWADYVTDAREYAAPKILFGNRLVLVSTSLFETPPELAQLPQLLGDGRLAIGDPAHVPAGQYAQEALEAVGIWDDVRDKLAPASDVRGALAFVVQGAAQFGIVYATDALGGVPVTSEIDPALHAPIAYYAVTRKDPDDAVAALMTYLRGRDALAITNELGFTVLE